MYHRRSIRLKNYDYSQEGLYFITICSSKMKHIFGKIQNKTMILNDLGNIVHQCWYDIPHHYNQVVLHNFVIIPPRGTSGTIGAIVRGFKIGVTKLARKILLFIMYGIVIITNILSEIKFPINEYLNLFIKIRKIGNLIHLNENIVFGQNIFYPNMKCFIKKCVLNRKVTMKTILYKSDKIGKANHGWLKTKHYFSFADYYNPQYIHFGALRVLNDDYIAPKSGFDMHPHENMEIITIPFSGELTHKDSMNNTGVIKSGDIQVMSAGTGVFHSEWNFHPTEPVTLFQIWIYPDGKNYEPRYQQIRIRDFETQNSFFPIISPYKTSKGMWIHQQAWMNIGYFKENTSIIHSLQSTHNGIFCIIIEGKAEIEGNTLEAKDAIGIWEKENISIFAYPNSKILLIEVPMVFNI